MNISNESHSATLPERIISPHDGLDAFRYNLTSLINDWPFTKHLAYRIFIRDMQAMFRMSFLGYFWLIAPALANTLVWVLLSSSEVVKIDSGDVPYPLFVFVGTWLWTAFNSCLTSSLGLVDEAKSTLVKVNFPIESVLLAGFGKNLLTVLVSGIGLIPFLLAFPPTLKLSMLLFPFELMMVMLFGSAIGLFFVPIAALFSDISRTIHLALRFAFFLTPVIYPIPAHGLTRTLMLANPVSCMIVTPRSSLLGGEEPAIHLFVVFSLLAILLFVMSLLAIKIALPHILERLSGT